MEKHKRMNPTEWRRVTQQLIRLASQHEGAKIKEAQGPIESQTIHREEQEAG